jgi:hypothetical protein
MEGPRDPALTTCARMYLRLYVCVHVHTRHHVKIKIRF